MADRRFRRTPGHRLLDAFDLLEAFPAHGHSRERLENLLGGKYPHASEVVAVVESDPALALAVLAGARGASVRSAIDAMPPGELERILASVPVYDFLDRSEQVSADAELLRLHAIATQRALSSFEPPRGARDELRAAALLHDIGKVVLLAAYPEYREIALVPGTPEERLAFERRELGVDHAMAGGVLARRLGLADSLVGAIECHHADRGGHGAAAIRLADMLAHYESGRPVDAGALDRAARALGLSDAAVRSLLYAVPQGGGEPSASPLSPRQQEILELLAGGRQYKQIALELGLSASTVRSHIQAIYDKLGVTDRAQAVLLASQHGWLSALKSSPGTPIEGRQIANPAHSPGM